MSPLARLIFDSLVRLELCEQSLSTVLDGSGGKKIRLLPMYTNKVETSREKQVMRRRRGMKPASQQSISNALIEDHDVRYQST